MRLKDLLIESSKKGINEFLRLVKKDEWLFQEPILYRGRGEEPEFNFIKREKRKTREPKDTSEQMNNLINCLHSIFLPEYPHRNRSTFGTHSLTVALDYGNYYMAIIPHKSAKISWSEKDAWWSYFKDGHQNLRTVLKHDPSNCINFDSSEAVEYQQIVTDLIKVMTQASNGDCTGFKKYKEKYGENPFVNPAMFMKLDTRTDSEPQECFLAAKKAVDYISKYLDDLTLGYPPDKDSFYEVVVEGPYLYVNMDFLAKHQYEIEDELNISFQTRRNT